MHLRFLAYRQSADAFREVLQRPVPAQKTVKAECGARVKLIDSCEAIAQVDCEPCLVAEFRRLRERVADYEAFGMDEAAQRTRHLLEPVICRLTSLDEAVA